LGRENDESRFGDDATATAEVLDNAEFNDTLFLLFDHFYIYYLFLLYSTHLDLSNWRGGYFLGPAYC
jgi:hypothetical protein